MVPVGCENLPVTAVLHYTDGLPPHELPVVVTGLNEDSLSMHGTEGALRRAAASQDPDMPAVVVTGSIAEMIGGGVTPEGSNLLRFVPRTIDEDQWQCADRAIYWLWSEFGAKKVKPKPRVRKEGETPRVNIIGPIYGTFNMPSDLAEIRRLVEGIGCEINLTFPLGSHIEDVSKLPNADVNICMYREFGRGLCEELDRPYLQAPIGLFATTNFLRKLGRADRARCRAVHRAREAHHDQAGVGFVAQRDAGFLCHRVLRRRRDRDLHARPGQLLRGRAWACPARFQFNRTAGTKPDNQAVKEALRTKARRSCCMARITSGCMPPSWAARCMYIPASFPGAIIRRSTGTPFMGYAGATYLVQEYCNALFDALFHILPLARDMDRAEPTPAKQESWNAEPWDADAVAALDDYVSNEPFLVRISAAKRLRDQVERDARVAREGRVTAERVARSLAAHGGRPGRLSPNKPCLDGCPYKAVPCRAGCARHPLTTRR